MSTTSRSGVVGAGCIGLVLTVIAFAGNLRWMDGEFRVGGETRADQLAKSTIISIQGIAFLGCCLLAGAIWRWRHGFAPAGGLRVFGFLLEGLGGAGLLAAVCGLITNSRGNLGDELDAMGSTYVIVLGIAVAAIAGGLGAWAVRSAGYREARAAAETVAMGL